MRVSALTWMTMLCAAGGLSAQQPPSPPVQYVSGPVCEAPRRVCEPRCESPPPAAPPAAPPSAPPGYYAAPPQNGVLQGASSSIEMEGAALRFPALEFKLPSLRLPSFSKIHQNARMHIEEARAPYVQQPPVAYGAPIAIQPVAAPPQAGPPSSGPPQAPPHQPPDCNAPRYAPPNCDAAAIQNLEQQLRFRDQKIAELDRQIGRMTMSMERMAQVVDRLLPVSTTSMKPMVDPVVREPHPAPGSAAVQAAHYAPAAAGMAAEQVRPRLTLAPAQPIPLSGPSALQQRWPVDQTGFAQ